MRTLIAGVGYSCLSDLSVGPIVAEQLRQQEWPDHIEVDDLSYGAISVVHRFAEASPPYDRLVLVGAADRGEKTARVRCYRWQGALPEAEEIQARVGEAITGIIDLDNLLIIAERFGVLPEEVFVVEVQPVVTEFGSEPSPDVAGLLPEVRRLVRAVAQATGMRSAHGERLRVLIAGVGNVLRGDDGFGIEVLRRLEQKIGNDASVDFFESGIAGVALLQQLMNGYDALIVLDAMDRGANPGTVFVLEPNVADCQQPPSPDDLLDLHIAEPSAVIRMAAALDIQPPRIWIIGCQAVECDEIGTGLSDAVNRAVPIATERVLELLSTLGTITSVSHAWA